MNPVFRILNKVVLPVHKYAYRKYYRQAVEKWPHLALEILYSADHWELLTDLTSKYPIPKDPEEHDDLI